MPVTGSEFRLSVPRLHVSPGEKLAVIGPSGSGKTTLLNLVSGIMTPDKGEVRVAGTEVSALRDACRRDFRIRNIGFVFQDFDFHGDAADYPITSVIAIPRDDKAGAILRGRYLGVAGDDSCQAQFQSQQIRVPGEVVAGLLANIFRIKNLLTVLLLGVVEHYDEPLVRTLFIR